MLIIKIIIALILIAVLASSRLLIPAVVGVAAFAFLRSRHKKEVAAESEPTVAENATVDTSKEITAAPLEIETVSAEDYIHKDAPAKQRSPRGPVCVTTSSGYEYDRVGIYRPANATLTEMPELDSFVFFEQDPENPYDDHAVKAVNPDGTLGYLNRGKLKDMVWDWLENDWEYEALVTRADSRLEIKLTLTRQ